MPTLQRASKLPGATSESWLPQFEKPARLPAASEAPTAIPPEAVPLAGCRTEAGKSTVPWPSFPLAPTTSTPAASA